MKKRRRSTQNGPAGGPTLFTGLSARRRRVLILPRYLAEEADKAFYRGKHQENAQRILVKWADLEANGHLNKKETALDANFLLEVFGEALRYLPSTVAPDKYHLERNYTVPGVGTADGALGVFGRDAVTAPVAVIELKDAGTDLDRDRFNGRTAVQQCWDYLNALPDCPWGIVSNFSTTRLYHRNKTPLAYQEFRLQDLRDLDKFRQFWCLLDIGGLLPSVHGEPRALMLLALSESRQREVSDKLYENYSANRYALIEHLRFHHKKPVDAAIRVAQKIIDRIIFIAFCEDRNLLPENCIKTAWEGVPPFTRVTNPRWQNFLALFQFVDKGHASLNLEHGYNGGLFEHDPEVDDLQLDDQWTNFFKSVGEYDFRDEINVEVLGHLFERSVGELERMRAAGMFEAAQPGDAREPGEPSMPKSPERKRFGIYYTRADFTSYIVERTLSPVIKERAEALRSQMGIASEEADRPSNALAAYWRGRLAALRELKVCDPACGSGAFLIQAYDLLDGEYHHIVEQLCFHEGESAESLQNHVAEWILHDNLFGVDLSREAVEITQLSLWIRSARRGQTLANLSQNIRHGNSLVAQPDADPAALDWKAAFPQVFARAEPGFDCVVGNPPWERLKLQEREFFAFSAPKIAGAVSAADRRKLIAQLQTRNPELYARYQQGLANADRTLTYVRTCDDFPLTARGDVNTYMLFAELASRLVAPRGRVGLLVPSGIATDHTTREFFGLLTNGDRLIALYDFENRERIFPDVDGRFKFCVLLFGGAAGAFSEADFVFFAHDMKELADPHRHIALSHKDIALLNPNTRTCPIFRHGRDADITKRIYRRVPILIDQQRQEGGNPWGIKFVTMFHQTNDAELFQTPEQLKEDGCKRDGNRWRKGKKLWLPLYEAKMVQAYDHRAASVVIAEQNWVRQGQTEETTLVEHQNPEFTVSPRWWVAEEHVRTVLGDEVRAALLCFKDVTSPTNTRTMIAAWIPETAVVNSAPLVITGEQITARRACCLLANFNSLPLDFVARQKVGGLHLNFFIVEQLPIFPPDQYDERCPWSPRKKLEDWIADRVLKLTCTSNDVQPLAEAAGMSPAVHKWREAERQEVIAELDAAFLHLYGLNRADAEYVVRHFGRRTAEGESGLFARERDVMEAYDRLANKS